MSELAEKLLDDIRTEHNIQSNKSNGNSIIFSQNTFTDKYHYSKELLNDLLSELKDYGYIEKWITGNFRLLEDE